MKIKHLQTGFKILITIGIFWYLLNNYSIILNFEFQKVDYFFYTIGIKSLNIFLIAFINLFAFVKLKTNISYFETLKIHAVSLLGNFFSFAKSGTAYKALILKNNFNLNLKEFSLFFILNQLLAVLTINLLTLIYFSYFYISEIDLIFFKAAIILIFVLISITALFISKGKLNLKNYYELFSIKILTILLICQTCSTIIVLLSNYLLSNGLGIKLTLADNLIYSVIAISSLLISITPNALGIREVLLVSFENFVQLNSTTLFNFSLADRIADLTMLVFVCIFFLGKNLILITNYLKK